MKYTLTIVFEGDHLTPQERADLYTQVTLMFGKRPQWRIENTEIKLRDDS